LKVAKEELAAMQKIADAEGAGFKLESWDWWYYAEKLRKEKYDLDEQQIKPYLKLENVRDGLFYVANKLYGLTFEKQTDIPVYNTTVETYQVKDSDSSHLAILYLDYPTREGKNAGAWCSGLRGYKKLPDGSEQFPLVTVTTNFPEPVDDQPVLLSWDEAETLFHEFGHALDGFFGRAIMTGYAGPCRAIWWNCLPRLMSIGPYSPKYSRSMPAITKAVNPCRKI